MKVIAGFLLAALLCVHAADEEILSKWAQFQAKYGKSYKSPIEERKRLGIFNSNLEKIDAHNELYEQGRVSYNYGVNQFADWTAEEFMAYVNRGKIDKPKIVRKTQKVNYGDTELPKFVDWRQKGAVTGVKNQGQCGSCWAFSTTGSLEGALKLKTGKLISLSEQNLVDCSGSYGNNGCHGGLIHKAFDYIKENGIQSEESYPYKAVDGQCEKHEIVTKISDYVNVEEAVEKDLQRAIATYGPIAAAMDATEKLQLYKSGILDDLGCGEEIYALNHGVLAVGFNGTVEDEQYYIVKNSWGEGWGEEGYFKLPMNYGNTCGIATMASYPIL